MTALDPRDTTDQLPYVADDRMWADEEEDLPVRPVRKRLGPFSYLLMGAVVAAGAFYGGVMVEKHHLPASTTVTAAARAGGAGGGAGAGAGTTFGTVKLIDGTNVYVQDTTGTITKVATNAQSAITITSTGTAQSIKPGDTVVVSGAAGADGTITATAIRDAGAGGGAPGGFGGGRRGAGAGATTAVPGGSGAAPPAGGFPAPPGG